MSAFVTREYGVVMRSVASVCLSVCLCSKKRVEEKVEELMDTVKQQTKLDSHLVHDCVDQAVRLKLAKDEEEMNEIKRTRTNVIIHGLQEPDEDSAEERKKHRRNRTSRTPPCNRL